MYFPDTAVAGYANPYTGVWMLIFAVLCILAYRLKHRRSIILPPGPPGDPILGHLRFIPLSYAWLLFAKWCKIYGDIFYIHVCGKPMVVLSSFAAARDLMEKRGRNYSDRPRLVMHSELMGWHTTMAFLPYGEEHRRQRAFVHAPLMPQGVSAHYPLIQTHVKVLLKNLARTPDDFRSHIRYCVACIVIRVTYGYDFESPTDPRKLIADKVNNMTVAGGNPGATIVDFLPILCYLPEWFPGAGFLRHAAETNSARRTMTDDLFDYAWHSKRNDTENLSLMSQLLEKFGDAIETDEKLKNTIKACGGVMYVAGVDTTDVTISTFILLMVRYPDIAKAAQRQIDAVTGGIRLPTFEDRGRLPYVDCIMKETWRWNPPLPMGIPHQSRDEDTYKGMTIPAKSAIVPNMWQMLRDETFYPDPSTFNPERFMPLVQSNTTSGAESSSNAADPKCIVFGFGRRICPGIHLADVTVWMALACILASFDILPPLDPVTGKEVIPEEKFMSNFTSNPDIFKCRLVPRAIR